MVDSEAPSEPDSGDERSVSPTQRRAILDREVNALTDAGLSLVSQIHYVAVLAAPESSVLIEIYVDGHGRVQRL